MNLLAHHLGGGYGAANVLDQVIHRLVADAVELDRRLLFDRLELQLANVLLDGLILLLLLVQGCQLAATTLLASDLLETILARI